MPTVWLDTDIGDDIDDAWALSVCLTHPQIRLLGVTTVYGDTVGRATLARWLIEATGKSVPVAAGEGEPFYRHAPTYRPNQMAALSSDEEERLRPERTDGVAFLAETVREYDGDDLVLLTIGPLTNAAKLLTEYPDAAVKIRRIVAMVGTLLPDHPQPEYNAKVDPTATRLVFESGKPLTVVGLDVTLRCHFSQEDLEEVAQSPNPLVGRLIALTRVWQQAYRRPDGSVPLPILHDPLAALVTAEPGLVTLVPMRVLVDDEGRTRKGEGTPNCQVAVKVQPEQVVARLKALLKAG